VARAGLRKIVFVNSHGGNEEIMGIVTRELRVRHRMLAVKTSWQRFGRPSWIWRWQSSSFAPSDSREVCSGTASGWSRTTSHCGC